MAEAPPDDDVTLPRAAVNKMIKEMIPNVRVSNDARELILNCCTEFIHLVSSEANEICNRQLKKTILPEHVFQALQGLGFTSYIEENKRRASTRLENLVEQEELQQLQQAAALQQQRQQSQSLPSSSSVVQPPARQMP
ncbi:Protein Dr1 [Acropora cervicornis]|uniref:Protein Dr1 n=1 Tax=Acropora cervicornis TaxID=6130 RepID=A0AAD9PZ88_ACRCE|nr:Protein Dr1 [Acropora cervicornis]